MSTTNEEWEAPSGPPPSAAPVVAVEGFDGPLDWLLELARGRRIDLRAIGLRSLVDALVDALDQALAGRERRADLTLWGEWLGMGAQLALLRSRLLLPPGSPEAKAAEAEAETLRRQLLDAAAMRRAGAWLDSRPQLGREMFPRGREPEAESVAGRTGDLVALFQACLVALRVPDQRDALTIPATKLWRPSDAMNWVARVLAGRREGGDLAVFLPRIRSGGRERDLRCRAAVASTFVAGLELCRAGAARLDQSGSLETLRISPR